MPIDTVGDDTICAIATPVGEGGVGIVRLSGPHAADVADKVVRLRSNKPVHSLSSHTLHLADILSADFHSGLTNPAAADQSGAQPIIDEGLVVYMKAPRSFTAEDVVEIHCHGSGIVLEQVCDACVVAGARLAQPGEFTKRAFLNGRLDLSQAEAVLDTIRAKSELGLKLAQRQLRGDLGQCVTQLRGSLIRVLAHVEAGIDFSEEDISFIGRAELIASLQDTMAQIQKMLATAETGRILREGIRVVLVGKPNVGKSSVLNSLLRENRAIVTAIPGTTRDTIEEAVVWGGLNVTLVDTAGLRETTDVVEQEGILRSTEAQDQADLVIHILDCAELIKSDRDSALSPSLVRQDLVVLNKIDLVDASTTQELSHSLGRRTGRPVVPISAKTGTGLEELKGTIRSLSVHVSLEPNDGVVITNLRHRVALERALASLNEALASVRNGHQAELIAVDLRGAAEALGEIVGVVTSDDILDRIFSEFCIGK